MKTKKRKMNFKILSLFVCILFGGLQLYGKGGNEHYQDMCDIFPFESCEKFNQLCNKNPYSINNYLDRPNWHLNHYREKRPNCVNRDSVFSKLRFEKHRIWFHWGLSDPMNRGNSMAPKFERLNSNTSILKLPKVEQERFWYELVEEEHQRLQKLLALSKQILGYSNAKNIDQVWAFVHILYDIHLMGDHTTTEYYTILPECDVRKDIEQQITILGGGENETQVSELLNFLRKQVPFTTINPSAPSITAQKYLDALKDENHGFGHFLMSCNGPNTNYRQRFEQAGFVIKYVYLERKAA